MVSLSMSLSLYVLLTGTLVLLSPVRGWGQEGHEMIGNIAYKLLSNETKVRIHTILQDHDDDHDDDSEDGDMKLNVLGKVSSWADKVRYTHEYHWSGPLHYIDIRDDVIAGGCLYHNDHNQCHFDYNRDCPHDFCVVGAILNFTKQLLVPSTAAAATPSSSSATAIASSTSTTNDSSSDSVSLKFIAHFVGDIHQPLHCSRKSDRGGNSIHIHFNDTNTNTNDSDNNNEASSTFVTQKSTRTDNSNHRNSDYDKNKVVDYNYIMMRDPRRGGPRESDQGNHQMSQQRRLLRHSNTKNKHSIDKYHHHASLNLHTFWDSTMIDQSIKEDYDGSKQKFEHDVYTHYVLPLLKEHDADDDDDENNKSKCPYCRCNVDKDMDDHKSTGATQRNMIAALKSCVSKWGEESVQLAMKYSYQNEDQEEILNNDVVDYQYYKTRLPIVKQRIGIASIRLSYLLETIFSSP